MRSLVAAISLASAMVLVSASIADARKRDRTSSVQKVRAELRSVVKRVVTIERERQRELEAHRNELASLRDQIWGKAPLIAPVIAGPYQSAIDDGPSVLSMGVPDVRQQEAESPVSRYVFPATCQQRGQYGDHRSYRRKGGKRYLHIHAGVDCGGVRGSPIVSIHGGTVLPPPGSDRGYGPRVAVIRHDDGNVCRYAHMDRMDVKPGQRVASGERIGVMGSVGRRGFVHLHFECMSFAEYRRRPYGVHSLDPNSLLGGERGSRMVAGVVMPADVNAARVADRVRVRRAGR